MGKTNVRDYVIWAKHISDDPRLLHRILEMRARERIALLVDNIPGTWEKMADGVAGTSTPGIKPIGPMKDVWGSLFRDRRNEAVEVREMSGGFELERKRTLIEPPLGLTEADRQAALQEFIALGNAGWCSDKPYGSRDELYD